jgi:carbon-monoxide dehydrogenase medium subunit
MPATAEVIARASASAAEGTSAPSDQSGKADYREHLVTVLTRRAVQHAAGI